MLLAEEHLPFKEGQVVCSKDVLGKIVTFDQESRRFLIRSIMNGEERFVRACDLIHRLDIEHPNVTEIFRGLVLNMKLSLSQLEDFKIQINELDADANLRGHLMCYYATRIWSFTRDEKKMEETLCELRALLEDVTSERVRVMIQTKVSTLLCFLFRHEEMRKILESIIDTGKHYGQLPEIAWRIFAVWEDLYEILPVHRAVRHLVKFGLYPKMFFQPDAYFLLVADNVSSAQDQFNNPKKIMDELIDDMRPHISKNSEVQKRNFEYVIGLSKMIRNDYDGALKNFLIARKLFAEKFGNVHSHAGVVKNIAECYARLGKKKQAKKAMRELKRTGGSKEEIDDLERILSKSRKTRGGTFRVEILQRCANPYCSQKEKEKGEFQVCGNCKRTAYCSKKCFKSHWRNGHKEHCNSN